MSYRILMAVILMLVLTGCRRQPPPGGRPDMRPTFSITDKNPLGLYIAYHAVETAFSGYLPEENKKTFESYFKDFTAYDASRKGEVYCIMARQFYPNEEDVDAMADYVSNGNTLLVAANDFSEPFLEKFHLKTTDTYEMLQVLRFGGPMKQTALKMQDSAAFGNDWYSFFFYPLQGQLYRETSYPSERIALNDAGGRSSGTVFKYGSGRIIATANATALTNYFLLTRNNYQYLQHLLSYVPEEINSLTWDSYYNRTETQRNNKNDESFSAFGELMKQEAFRWAFWLTLLLAATWIINGLIRRQRPVPVLKPNANTSVTFAETIGRLYLLKKDNKNIATKMITYFLEQVRSRYYISTGRLDDRFVELLSAKSGQPVSETEKLLQTFNRINIRDRIDDLELLELNAQLRKFIS